VFAIGMVIGIVSGAYSSIFNASQIVVVWERYRANRKAAGAGTAVRRRERARLMGSTASVEIVAETDLDEEAEGDEDGDTEGAPGARRLSAQEALARAEEAAQEEKRAERRERRKAAKGKSKGKRRF